MNNSAAFTWGKHILSYLIYYNISIDRPLAFKNDLCVSSPPFPPFLCPRATWLVLLDSWTILISGCHGFHSCKPASLYFCLRPLRAADTGEVCKVWSRHFLSAYLCRIGDLLKLVMTLFNGGGWAEIKRDILSKSLTLWYFVIGVY